ncbi:hypothetical protein AAII07_38545 [Microvirga sp. 0TCS3.31]
MVVIDTRLARGASSGEFTVHDRGGPYGRTKGTTRVVAVDVAGLPVPAVVVPASTHEKWRVEIAHGRLGRSGRLARKHHHHCGDGLAPSRLHRHDPATPVPGTSPPAPSRACSLTHLAAPRTARLDRGFISEPGGRVQW